MHQSKITYIRSVIQRPGYRAANCKMLYYLHLKDKAVGEFATDDLC